MLQWLPLMERVWLHPGYQALKGLNVLILGCHLYSIPVPNTSRQTNLLLQSEQNWVLHREETLALRRAGIWLPWCLSEEMEGRLDHSVKNHSLHQVSVLISAQNPKPPGYPLMWGHPFCCAVM
ncbi:unnamed protein product [Arctogadus glacialis]